MEVVDTAALELEPELLPAGMVLMNTEEAGSGSAVLNELAAFVWPAGGADVVV